MRALAWAERLLWVAGLGCACVCVGAGVEARESRVAAASIHPVATAPAGKQAQGDVIGRIEIPALSLSAPITADYDVNSLRRGVGHIPGTAVPGGLGTVGLAGHRDSFFRPLRRIAPKMDIRLVDAGGTFHYAVDSTEVVNPERVQVLDIAARPELTLITCFPFDFVGAAPRRFIVHAHLVSAAPDAEKQGVGNRE